jgi:hypothetical protein
VRFGRNAFNLGDVCPPGWQKHGSGEGKNLTVNDEYVAEQTGLDEQSRVVKHRFRLRHRWYQKLWPWARVYWLDLALVLLLLVAVSLVVEPWGIWERLFEALGRLP